jgi:WD40 repeat protein
MTRTLLVLCLIGLLTGLFARVPIPPAAHSQDRPPPITPASAPQMQLQHLWGHGDMNSLAFAPTGETLAIGSSAGIMLHKTEGLAQVDWHFAPHAQALAFGFRGDWLAHLSNSRAWLLNLANRARSPLGDAIVQALAVAPDGGRLATATLSGGLQLWRPDGQLVQEFPDLNPTRLEFSPDATRLMMALPAGPALLSLDDFGLHRLDGCAAEMPAVTFSASGDALLAGTIDGTLCRWPLLAADEAGPATQISAATAFRQLLAGPAGRLYGLAEDEALHILNSTSGATEAIIPLEIAPIDMALSPDGGMLALLSAHQLRLLAGESLAEIGRLSSPPDVWSLAWSPDGDGLAAGDNLGQVFIWTLAQPGQPPQVLPAHQEEIWGLDWSPDGRTLVTASLDDSARRWELATGQRVATLAGHTDNLSGVAFSADGSRVATASLDGTLRVWDAESGATLMEIAAHDGYVLGMDWSDDGRLLASSGADNRLVIWDAATGEARQAIPTPDMGPVAISLSPDGRQVAAAGLDTMARIYAVESGELLHELAGHEDALWSIDWSPDGSLIATGADGADASVRVWDARRGEERAVLRGHRGRLHAVRWSPDGAYLASGSDDGTVRVWGLPSPD